MLSVGAAGEKKFVIHSGLKVMIIFISEVIPLPEINKRTLTLNKAAKTKHAPPKKKKKKSI